MANLESIAKRVAESMAGGFSRTAGRVEFVKDQGPVRRDVRVKGYEWSPDSLRDLAKILWSAQRAHSYAMAALRIFSKMPSSDFSPDGLLGGRGYIQSIKDMRSGLAGAVEELSTFTDTVHDEINADHWSPVEEKADIDGIMEDVGDVKENPEEFVEEEFEDEEMSNPVAENPEVESDDEDEDEASTALDTPRLSMNIGHDGYKAAFDNLVMHRVASRIAGGGDDELYFRGPEPLITDRDVPGPRAFPLGPAEGGELGSYDDPAESPPNPMDSTLNEQELLIENGLCLPMSSDFGDGDNFRVSSEGYSWLPGSENLKGMNWYDKDLTDEDIEWMQKNCKPDVPSSLQPKREEVCSESLWDGVRLD